MYASGITNSKQRVSFKGSLQIHCPKHKLDPQLRKVLRSINERLLNEKCDDILDIFLTKPAESYKFKTPLLHDFAEIHPVKAMKNLGFETPNQLVKDLVELHPVKALKNLVCRTRNQFKVCIDGNPDNTKYINFDTPHELMKELTSVFKKLSRGKVDLTPAKKGDGLAFSEPPFKWPIDDVTDSEMSHFALMRDPQHTLEAEFPVSTSHPYPERLNMTLPLYSWNIDRKAWLLRLNPKLREVLLTNRSKVNNELKFDNAIKKNTGLPYGFTTILDIAGEEKLGWKPPAKSEAYHAKICSELGLDVYTQTGIWPKMNTRDKSPGYIVEQSMYPGTYAGIENIFPFERITRVK